MQKRLHTVLWRANHSPVVEAAVESELERDHVLLLHFPRSIHVERLLKVLLRNPRRVLLAFAHHEAARCSQPGWSLIHLPPRLAIHLGQLLHIRPGDLRPKEDAIGKTGRPPCRPFALGAHLDGWMRLLVRRKTHPAPGDLRVRARERDLFAGPEPFHELEGFLQLRGTVLSSEADGLKFALAITDGDAQHQTAMGDVVQR